MKLVVQRDVPTPGKALLTPGVLKQGITTFSILVRMLQQCRLVRSIDIDEYPFLSSEHNSFKECEMQHKQ